MARLRRRFGHRLSGMQRCEVTATGWLFPSRSGNSRLAYLADWDGPAGALHALLGVTTGDVRRDARRRLREELRAHLDRP